MYLFVARHCVGGQGNFFEPIHAAFRGQVLHSPEAHWVVDTERYGAENILDIAYTPNLVVCGIEDNVCQVRQKGAEMRRVNSDDLVDVALAIGEDIPGIALLHKPPPDTAHAVAHIIDLGNGRAFLPEIFQILTDIAPGLGGACIEMGGIYHPSVICADKIVDILPACVKKPVPEVVFEILKVIRRRPKTMGQKDWGGIVRERVSVPPG